MVLSVWNLDINSAVLPDIWVVLKIFLKRMQNRGCIQYLILCQHQLSFGNVFDF